jgi:hypothetical protein
LFQLVEEKVPKIDFPWIEDGKTSFVPTRVKWIESLASRKRKNGTNHMEKKDT